MALVDVEEDLLALAEALRPGLLRASRHMRREAQKAGVSALDAQLLGTIHKQPGVTGGELAEAEQMSAPSMSAHLKRLEAAGWIKREPPGQGDRRRVGLRVSAAGEAALAAIRAQRNAWLIRRLEALPPRDRRAIAAAAEPLKRLAGDR
jgi:DNA-binding MarR family transcriptional regulator